MQVKRLRFARFDVVFHGAGPSLHRIEVTGRHLKARLVWFAPSWKTLFNSAADNQMANEPFSRGLRDQEFLEHTIAGNAAEILEA